MDTLVVSDLRVSYINETSVGLAWTPVSCFLTNNQQSRIRVETVELSTGLLVDNIFNADSGNIIISLLQLGTAYMFTVFGAVNQIWALYGLSVNATTRHCEMTTIANI